jgi:hypothetical protein
MDGRQLIEEGGPRSERPEITGDRKEDQEQKSEELLVLPEHLRSSAHKGKKVYL